MKKILYVLTMTLILMSMLVAGDASAGALRVTIKGRPTTTLSSPSTRETSNIVAIKGRPTTGLSSNSTRETSNIVARTGVAKVIRKSPSMVPRCGSTIRAGMIWDILSCGETLNFTKIIGGRFGLSTSAIMFDRKHCRQWFRPAIEENLSLDKNPAEAYCDNVGMRLPTLNEIEELTEEYKENPAVVDDFPYYLGRNGCSILEANGYDEVSEYERLLIESECKVWYYADQAKTDLRHFSLVNGSTESAQSTSDPAQVWCVEK